MRQSMKRMTIAVAQDYPEACQLMRSLLRYVGSERFQPAQSLDWETLKRIL